MSHHSIRRHGASSVVRVPADLLDALADDPMRRSTTLAFLRDSLAGDVHLRSWWSEDESAAVVGFEYSGEPIPLSFDLSRLLGVPRGATGERWLIVGTPVRLRHTLYGCATALAPLLERVGRECRAWGLDGVVVPWVDLDDGERGSLLADLGFRAVFSDADWRLDTGGSTDLDGLLAALPRTARKQFASDRNHFSRTHCTIRDWQPGDEAFAPRLHREFMTDHGHRGAEFTDDAFGSFSALPGARMRVAVDDEERPVGFAMAIHDDTTMHVLRWARPSRGVPDRLYSMLGYLDPVEFAIGAGVERVWLGKSAHRFKRLRGLTPVPAAFHFLAFDPDRHARLGRAAETSDRVARERYRLALES
ncbi:peptidogalycan biosysnthesis protein [Rathayibacter sp. VKM Ac-2857]|uniref:peptidogalycan biosysnthesis protein n=1 Tax=Rathayibacter sp. VKM Ac-2857 TaxID=2739020 RepID=UPI001566A623|nr:peptidogalycan biosysnthesis protein [Rathayibacter sp. VKM Ac-2857]NQX14341.1 N-acetyltransferase [Rathayibacter sp. VKM Ac-2857]